MGYNNSTYGKSGSAQSGSKQQANNRQPPPEIRPEKVPEDYIDRADTVMRELSEQRQSITTSKIRNLLSLVSGIYDVERLRTEQTLTKESIAGIGMMRIRTAYECGRDKDTKLFVEKARLLQYLKGIGDSREDLIAFAHYMEALVAYHRFYGGKES